MTADDACSGDFTPADRGGIAEEGVRSSVGVVRSGRGMLTIVTRAAAVCGGKVVGSRQGARGYEYGPGPNVL
jgi:hypothetical protein